MKISYREYLGQVLIMFIILTLSTIFVDAAAGDDVFRIFKLQPYKYVLFFFIVLLGAYGNYWVTKKSAQDPKE